ncbi:MAG: FtsX-like permease family protein [Thermodesulfobacteriota bacterium]|nr:FtsX-like permease family protein [Thermodesulfobacteriota bacterium]
MFKFALRNVLRNKRRSFLTVLTIFLAAVLVGLAQGWVNGIMGVYIDNFTKYQTGHVRITTEEYTKREKFLPVDEIVFDPDRIINDVLGIKGVRTVKERIRFAILLGNRETTVESVGMGIDLQNNEFNLSKRLKTGRVTKSGIYVGNRLAEKLGVSLGQDLLIATKTSEGGLNGIKLKINGIFNFGMMYDKKFFFMGLKDAKRLLKIYNGTTEIFVFANETTLTDQVKAEIEKILPKDIKAETYKEQLGDFYDTLETTKSVYGFIEALILFLASFVIINTMMMAVFERLKEIGTMKALGMTDRDLFMNFTCEGAILGIVGGVAGATVGFLLILALAQNGIDFSAQIENIEMPFEYVLRPKLRFTDLSIALGISIFVPTLAAMIPARYARKLMPAEALRK